MKEEALKLAEDIANGVENIDRLYLSHIIRGLVARIDLLLTKPLSDEEIEKIYEESYLPIGSQEWEFDCVVFARAIEERHGIK